MRFGRIVNGKPEWETTRDESISAAHKAHRRLGIKTNDEQDTTAG
jgi:hypothetical protein